MALRIGGNRNGAMAEINVTPMADVVIVLLIVFMLATPLLRESAVVLPPAQRAVDRADDPPVLVLDAAGTLRLKGAAVAGDAAVFAETLRLLDGRPGPRVVALEAAEELPFSRLETLLARLRAHGVRELTLVTRATVGA